MSSGRVLFSAYGNAIAKRQARFVHWRASFSRHESTAPEDVESKGLPEASGTTGLEPRKEEGRKGIAEPPENRLVHSSYWGIGPRKITREDGSVWPWNCFMPWETYRPSVDIDLSKHHVPKTFLDKFAYWTVKFLRVPTDIFFQRRYGCRAMMLETVAAVPGMVGGMLLHCKSLRKFEHSGGWIKALLEEAENERMHLMTMVEIVQPKWYERALVLAVQGVFFNSFFLLYVISPKLAHRIVGYLEEEAIHSYTEFLKELDNGNIENVPAPLIAIDYWRLPEDANLRDVVVVIRADEAHHRDVNHFASTLRLSNCRLIFASMQSRRGIFWQKIVELGLLSRHTEELETTVLFPDGLEKRNLINRSAEPNIGCLKLTNGMSVSNFFSPRA